jgi:hypothetical protein
MNDVSEKPLSALISQGWDVSHYSTTQDTSGMLMHCFLLRKSGRAKLLSVRAKVMGEGFVSVEKDI